MQDQSTITPAHITTMSDDEMREHRLYAAVATAQMLADGLEAHARERAKVFATMTAELDHRN